MGARERGRGRQRRREGSVSLETGWGSPQPPLVLNWLESACYPQCLEPTELLFLGCLYPRRFTLSYTHTHTEFNFVFLVGYLSSGLFHANASSEKTASLDVFTYYCRRECEHQLSFTHFLHYFLMYCGRIKKTSIRPEKELTNNHFIITSSKRQNIFNRFAAAGGNCNNMYPKT